jgi:hypothetical protein
MTVSRTRRAASAAGRGVRRRRRSRPAAPAYPNLTPYDDRDDSYAYDDEVPSTTTPRTWKALT